MRTSSVVFGPAVSLCALASFATFSSNARASNVTEFPDNGSEQMGRGGAWVARASDPVAAYFNPAGLAGQATRVTLQNNLIVQHTCFARVKASGGATPDLSQEPLEQKDATGAPTGQFPRVCNDIEPNVSPQLAMTLRVSDRVGLGFMIFGPNAAGNSSWPDFIRNESGLQASPNRYLLNTQSGIVLFPTIAVGVEVIDNLRLGASLQWGIANLKLGNTAVALNTDAATPANDIHAVLSVKDYFVPGFTLGALYSPTEYLDVGGWYKWSDAIRARGNAATATNFYTKENAGGNDSKVKYGDTFYPDCGTGTPADQASKPCGNGDVGTVKFNIPMEAKLGFRYHKPRRLPVAPPEPAPPAPAEEGAAPPVNPPPPVVAPPAPDANKHVRDPLSQDVFDTEVDLTWANNSAIDAIQIRFPGDSDGNGILPVSGIPGGTLPPNADSPKHYKDVLGVRVGGDYNLIPDTLALRGGAFYETLAQDQQYQNIDFPGGAKLGLSAGGTLRIHLGRKDLGKTNALEIMLGYGHVFFTKQTNNAFDANGVPALAGTPCNPTATVAGDTCPGANATQKYRTNWPVNLGTITSAVNVINVGVAYRF